jgi:hypothetical protein
MWPDFAGQRDTSRTFSVEHFLPARRLLANNRRATVGQDIAARPAPCHGYSPAFRTVEWALAIGA